MAIDKMRRVTFFAPRHSAEALVELLQRLKLVHVDDFAAKWVEQEPSLERLAVSAQEAQERVGQLSLIQAAFDELAPAPRRFVESLVPLPLRVSEGEMRRVVAEFDLPALYGECRRLYEEHKEQSRLVEQAEAQAKALEFMADLPLDLDALARLKRVRAWAGWLSRRQWADFQADPWALEHLAWEALRLEKRQVGVLVVALAAEAEQAQELLRRYGFLQWALPEPRLPLRERLRQLRADAQAARERCELARGRVAELAAHRRQVAILLGYWRAELARAEALSRAVASRRVVALSGYVRERDAGRLEREVRARLPGVSVVLSEVSPGENVPVSLTLGPLLKPMQFLVDMFGRPDYFSFDPTPYLSLSFLLFFGFCFGDAIYGLMLCAVAGWLAHKVRGYERLHNMCMLFFYCGISTVIVGVLTGGWAADLWREKYLGAGNPLLWIKERTALVDPLDRAILMLLVALGIGVANQFYGVVLKGYALLRRGDWQGAIFDAGLWLLALPGFLIVFGALFFPEPAWLFRAGLALFAVGGLGLVLTQGRGERSLLARAVTGVVSLYGILGSYGCVAFLGDTLSYCRLLALGLTTTIVGMAFNEMASLLRGVPAIGTLLFVGALVLGHLFNFAVSILGAFVHPARLIFLEFFSRFYQGGSVPFRPLSRDTEGVLVTQ